MDRFSALLEHSEPVARSFFSGNICETVDFDSTPAGSGSGLGYLHILRTGRVNVERQNARMIEVDEPALVLLPRPYRHRLVPDVGQGADLTCATVDLGAGSGSPLALSLPDVVIVPMAQLTTLQPSLALLVDEAFSTRDGRQASLDRLFEYVLIQILRHLIDVGGVTSGALAALAEPGLSRAVTAMHDAPSRLWTLDDLATEAGMSRTRFARVFRETVGTTPIDYLTQWRVSIACKQLRLGRHVKSVAGTVGYASHAAFSRAFAKVAGQSPREWQAGAREGLHKANLLD